MSHQYNQMVVAQQQQQVHQSQSALNEMALANMLSHQSLNGSSTQHLHQQLTGGQNNALNGNNNTNNLAQPTILMTPMLAPIKPAHMYAQQQQPQQMQHSNQVPANPGHGQPLFNQTSAILQQHQHQQQIIANGQQQQPQQVPINTISIPASTVSQLQNVSMQIQQAAQQAAPNQQHPQILVFMIPYMINPQQQQHLQQQLNSQQQQQQQHILPHPITPDQASLNSTLVRQSHSNSSIMRQSHPAQQNQQQQQQQLQTSTGASTSLAAHSRAVSSLSNATITTATKQQQQHQEPEKFHIKTNFSYQPSRNRQELSFKKGDILHVLDTLQNNDYGVQYWLATRVKANGEDAEKGLIPNKNKAEEITIEQRTLDISEHATGGNSAANSGGGGSGPGVSGTLDGSSTSGGVLSASVGRVNFLKRRSAQRSKSLCKDNWDNVVFDIGSFRLPAYERVVYKHPGFCRPVVIFGPLSDLARQKLLKDYPEKYSYPSGISQSPDHPKVIRLKGVIDVIDQGKHALLDITAQAVEKLNYVNLAPIVIFMKTDSKSIIKEFRSRAAKSMDPNARDEDTLRRDGKSSRKLLEQSVKLEKQWSHVFTATLDLSTMGSEMWYRKLRETIENQQSANVWMGEKKSEKKLAAAAASSSSLGTASMLAPNQTISDGSQTALYSTTSQLGGRNTQLMSSTSSSSNPAYLGQSSHQQPHSLGVPAPTSGGLMAADSSSMLNEKFNECLNISQQGGGGAKSTNDLIPLPGGGHIDNAGLYGNRSQLRNAYAHSLAQKLARASSEPKLNGLMSDNEDEDDVDRDEDDDDEDDDDEIIKKPPLFPSEFENSSSISSSNGIGGGPSANYGHSSLTGASSSSSNAQLQHHPAYQQHSSSYQMLPQIKPPAPLPPQAAAAAAAAAAMAMAAQQHEQSLAIVSDQQHHLQQQQQQQLQPHHHHSLAAGSSHRSLLGAGVNDNSIYSMNGGDQMIPTNGNGSFTNGISQQQQQMISSKASDYYPLPPMPGDNGYSNQQQQQQSHSQQMHGLQQTGMMHAAPNQAPNSHQHQHLQAPAPTPTNGNSNSTNSNSNNNNQVIDLTRNHDTRGSAFQIYSDMNQNSYHYYNMNKI